MPLALVFVATFVAVYLVQRRRGAAMLDRLHRATLAAMGAAFLVLVLALLLGG